MAQPLELNGVSIAFAGRSGRMTVVIEGLSFGVRSGRLHCVAGPSGSGKTSVLRVAAGLVEPTSGTVSWNGESLAGLSDEQRSERRSSNIGYVDQNATLLDHLSALENVLLPAIPRRSATELVVRAQSLLAELGVEELADARANTLSLGERRRVALARAQLLRPTLLILDEPTSGLDRVAADDIIGLLQRLRGEGTAILVATHDQALIDAADMRTSLDVRQALSTH